jgi:hypothetical protein
MATSWKLLILNLAAAPKPEALMDETGTIAPGRLCPVSAALLFCDPAPDVLRAVEQRHAIALAVSQEKNGFPVNQGEFFEIEHYRRSVVVDKQLANPANAAPAFCLSAGWLCFAHGGALRFSNSYSTELSTQPQSCNLKTIRKRWDYRALRCRG